MHRVNTIEDGTLDTEPDSIPDFLLSKHPSQSNLIPEPNKFQDVLYDEFSDVEYMPDTEMWSDETALRTFTRLMKIQQLEHNAVAAMKVTCANFNDLVRFLREQHTKSENHYRVRFCLDDTAMKFSVALLHDSSEDEPLIGRLIIGVSPRLHPDVTNNPSYDSVVAERLRQLMVDLWAKIDGRLSEISFNLDVSEQDDVPDTQEMDETDELWNLRTMTRDMVRYHGKVFAFNGVEYFLHDTSPEEDELLEEMRSYSKSIMKLDERAHLKDRFMKFFTGREIFRKMLRSQLIRWREYDDELFVHVKRWNRYLVFSVNRTPGEKCVSLISAPGKKAWSLWPVEDEFDLTLFKENAWSGQKLQAHFVSDDEINDLFDSLARHVFYNYCAKDMDGSYKLFNAEPSFVHFHN
jgi:hypothetical protein